MFYYIARKQRGHDTALSAIKAILATFVICPLNIDVLDKAISLSLADYEDNLQLASALDFNLDAIITRGTLRISKILQFLFIPRPFFFCSLLENKG